MNTSNYSRSDCGIACHGLIPAPVVAGILPHAKRRFADAFSSKWLDFMKLSDTLPSRGWLVYRVDWMIIGMIAAALIDISTTYYIVSLNLGIEANPVLAPLLRHSLVWIPVFGLIRPLLVPLLPNIPRRAVASYLLVAHLSGGFNNLAGIFFHNFFIINTLGYWIPLLSCYLIGLLVFIHDLYRIQKGKIIQILILLGCVVVFFVIDGLFYLLGLYL